MTSQFKNPLPRKNSPKPQNTNWLVGDAPNVASAERVQSAQRETPPPIEIAGLQTIKQPSVSVGPNGLSGSNAPPQPYVNGSQGRYGGPGPGSSALGQLPSAVPHYGPQATPQGPVGPQMFAPPQPARPSGALMGPGVAAGPVSVAPGLFNQANSGAPLSMPGMVTASPLPGTLNPNMGPSSFGTMPPGIERRRSGSPPPPNKGKKRKKRRVPIWARVVIGFLTLLIILAVAGYGYYQANFASAVNSIVGQQVQHASGDGNPNAGLTNGILTGPRVNILLLGSDTDQKFQGQYLAQSDIIVTINPSNNTVGMLSIPRDFYINVPGYGLHKLDEAYSLGGVALSEETITQDFGIPINYYAWVGLDGFIKVIDDVGGVDVNVLHPIVDDQYPDDVGNMANDPYAFKRLYIPPGPQHLDGETALEYVRSRHADLVGDFGRSARQQQVLTALKTKLDNPDVFSKLSQIANDLKGYLKTDMQLPDVLKLMNFGRSLNLNSIQKLVLGPPYSTTGTAPAGTPDAGASVVIPDCEKIIPAIAQMLQLGNNAACNIEGDSGSPSATALPAAYRTGQPSPTASAINNAEGFSYLVSNTTASLSSNPGDLFGIQSLLDLLLMGVFESPDVF